MLSAALAFVGALVYGSADFLGGLASRRLPAVLVTAVVASSGMVLLLALAPFVGGSPTADDLRWGALSGIVGSISVVLLYGCLAIGPMSVLSPVTAVVSAVAPMLWGVLVGGERLGALSVIGLGLAIVAIVLVALLPGERITRPSARGLAMAVGSGLAIGAFLIVLDQFSADAGLLPLALGRAVNSVIMAGAVACLVALAVRAGRPARSALATRQRVVAVTASGHVDAEPHHTALPLTARRAWTLALVCGLVDASANVLLVLALRTGGDLAVVAALTALYPAGTVVLAAVVLRERITALQWLGLALALAAGVLLAVA